MPSNSKIDKVKSRSKVTLIMPSVSKFNVAIKQDDSQDRNAGLKRKTNSSLNLIRLRSSNYAVNFQLSTFNFQRLSFLAQPSTKVDNLFNIFFFFLYFYFVIPIFIRNFAT